MLARSLGRRLLEASFVAARSSPEVQAAHQGLRAISTGASLQVWNPVAGSQDDAQKADFFGLTAWQRAALKGEILIHCFMLKKRLLNSWLAAIGNRGW